MKIAAIIPVKTFLNAKTRLDLPTEKVEALCKIMLEEILQILSISPKIEKIILITKEKKAIETGVSDLKNALKGTDVEEIKKKTQELVQVSMKLGEAVYKSQQKDTPGKPGDPSGNPEDQEAKKDEKENVVDADFEDVKDDKEKSA